MHLHGTARGVPFLQKDGILPTRNFRDGAFAEASGNNRGIGVLVDQVDARIGADW